MCVYIHITITGVWGVVKIGDNAVFEEITSSPNRRTER